MLDKVKLPLHCAEKVKVKIASVELIPGERECNGVRVKIQGTTFRVEVHVFVLADCDTVPEIQWLRELGLVLWNSQKLTIKFATMARQWKYRGWQLPN